MPQAETWRFNRPGEIFERVTADGVLHTATYAELSGEDFTLTSTGTLVDNQNGFNRYQQGGGEISYVRYGNGYGELTSELLTMPRSLFTTEQATYGISGTMTVRMPDGTERDVGIDAADLMGVGQHVYTWTGPDGTQEYGAWLPGSQEMLSAQAAAGDTWREATTDEIITYATRGYLANNHQGLLADYAGAAGEGTSAAARAARYDAAHQLAQLGQIALTYFKSHLVGFSRT